MFCTEINQDATAGTCYLLRLDAGSSEVGCLFGPIAIKIHLDLASGRHVISENHVYRCTLDRFDLHGQPWWWDLVGGGLERSPKAPREKTRDNTRPHCTRRAYRRNTLYAESSDVGPMPRLNALANCLW